MRDDRRLRVLHLILMLGETNSQYNEHCLPSMEARDLSVCTYFVPRLTPPPQIRLFAGDGTLPGFFRALRAALDADRYDVVHVHAPQTGLLLPVALIVWRRFRRLRPSLVYTVHDSFFDYKLRDQALTVISLVAFPLIVFCSRSAYESIPVPLKRLVRARWRLVQNGADFGRVDRVLASRPPMRDPGRFTVLSVGRLDPVKDPVTLVHAFARAPDRGDRLVFIGTGTLDGALADEVNALGLQDRVSFSGLIPRDEVFARCAAADVLVSTSHGEGLPVAVMEAMACGCPVILSDIPQHRELLDGAAFVPLVAEGDVDGFARAIGSVRALSPEDRRELGLRGREHVVARFDVSTMQAGYQTVYRELVRTRETGVGVR